MKQVDSQSAVGATGVQPLGLARLPVLRIAALPLVRAVWLPATLGVLLVLSAVVRLYNLVENPPGFFADEASYGYNAYTILHTGRDEFGARLPLFFKAFGEYKLPIYIYSQVPITALIGLSELSVRLTSAIYGTLTVAAIYLLVKSLFQRQGPALACAAVLAISPWHIFYSRTGLGEVIVWPFFFVLSLWLFMQGTRKPAYWLLAGAAFGLTVYAYRPAWVTLPPLLLLLTVLYFREAIQSWRFALAGVFLFAAIVAPLPMHLYSVDSDRAQEQSILELDLGTWGTFERFTDHYGRHFDRTFLFETTTEINMRHVVPGAEWVYVWQVPFMILGIAALLWKPTRPKIITLAVLAIYPLGTSLTQGSPSSSRSVLGAIAFTLVTGYGIATAASLLSSIRWQWRGAAVGAGAAGVLLAGTAAYAAVDFSQFLDTYHGSYRQAATGGWGWQWGAHDILARFEKDQDQYDELVMESGAFNAPDIFFRFYRPEGCPKCWINNWDRFDANLRQLFAMRPETMSPAHNFDILDTLYAPNGDVAFIIAEIADGPHDPRGAMGNVGFGSPMTTLDEFYTAITADPKNPLLYVDRGNLYWEQRKFWDAIYDYNKAIELDPNLAVPYYNRGNLYSAVGIFDWAGSDYNTAIGLDPSLLAAQNNLGDVYVRAREYQVAVATFTQVIAANPNLAIAYANRAIAHVALAEPELALADADRAIELDPNLALAHYARGRAQLAHVTYVADAVIVDLAEAIRLDSGYGEAYYERARLYIGQARNAEAIADLDRAVDVDRDFALGYAYRGLAYLAAGDAGRGAANLDKAVFLDRAYRNTIVERNPQYQWSLLSLEESYVNGLEKAVTAVTDGAAAQRLQPLVAYLSARAAEQ